MIKNTLYIGLLLGVISACSAPKQDVKTEETTENDSISFNSSTSDPRAISLAEEVIAAHGGKAAWDNTRYIAWNFLGSRDLIWDKYTGLVRIDFPREESTYIINILQDTGQVMFRNKLVEKDSLGFFVNRGRQMWVNDAYWLVFPFKLKDPGVQLHYFGVDTTKNGQAAELISLQFEDVGYTPENKYYAYIDPKSKMILQWDYFSKVSDSVPAISNVWTDYAQYGDLMLSSGRDQRRLSNIRVSQSIDTVTFEF